MRQERKTVNEIRLEFPSHSCNEAFARTAAAAFALCMDPTIEELSDIKTAVSEAVTNAIVHGYPDRVGQINMECTAFSTREIRIQVTDRGVGIPDIRRAREPMFTTGGEERSGMGFTIMEHFMTLLEVASVPGEGTSVTMYRKLSDGEANS